MRSIHWTLSLATLVAVLPTVSHAAGDPSPYVESTDFTPTDTIVNPFPLSGDIAGADAINHGTPVIMIWNNGDVAIYDENNFTTPVQTFSVNCGAGTPCSAISEVGPNFPGPIAISNGTKIDFYDYDGLEVALDWYDGTDTITAMTYDGVRDQLWITLNQVGVKLIDFTGSLTDASLGGNPPSLEYVELSQDGVGALDDVLQASNSFNRVSDETGDTTSIPNHNLQQTFEVNGMAYTQNHMVNTADGGFFVYGPTDFHPFINFGDGSPGIPTVSTWGMLALVLCVLVAGTLAFRPRHPAV